MLLEDGKKNLFFVLRCALSELHLPKPRHLLGFFASLGRSEVGGRIPSHTLENLLAIFVPIQASLELKRNNFLSLCLFLNTPTRRS